MRTIPPKARAGRVIVLDPATRRCGVAVFVEGVLQSAMTVRAKTTAGVVNMLGTELARADSVVIETPVTHKRATARHEDLRGLRVMVRLVRKTATCPVLGVTPRQWKGNVPKEITAARALAILSDAERAAIRDDSDDTTDAIGLGLVALTRAKRGVA